MSIIARAAGAVALAVALGGVTGGTASSAPAAGPSAGPGAYAGWTASGSAGTMTVPAAGFPPAGFTTNSTSTLLESGKSDYLSADTPFGAVFGSSRGQQYAVLRTAAHLAPSTTTFTFETPAPAGNWGFALANIDADQVTISATDATGAPVPAAGLGFQSSFNYCAVSPRPSGCRAGPFTDQPTWNQATSTLRGNGTDTDGATGWFRPAADVKTLTFTFSRIIGSPSYQVWFAALSADIAGSVTTTTGDEPPPATVELLQPPRAGSPVRHDVPVQGADGHPVTATTDAHGSYAFTGVARGRYVVELDPPAGFRAHGPVRRAVNATHGNVTGVNFALHRTSTPTPPAAPLVPVTG